MRTVTLPLPMFGFVVATRAALGVGLGLLIGDRLSSEQRRRVGTALLAFGAATTIPAVRLLSRRIRRGSVDSATGTDVHLIGATRFARKGDELY